MTDEVELREITTLLLDPNVAERASMLKALGKEPTGGAALLPYLEALLEDRTPCLEQVRPFVFCEIRWMAACALAAERRAQGIATPVCIVNIARPIIGDDILDIEPEYYSKGKRRADIEGHLEAFALASSRGLLPTVDLILPETPAR